MQMTSINIDIRDEAATRDLAFKLAPRLGPGDVLALEGALGAGKTAFARYLIAALAGQETEVPSPTFTLVQNYETEQGEVWHFDLYRIKTPDEVIELGWEEALGRAIILVEWPQHLGALLPADRLDVKIGFDGVSDQARRFEITPQGDWKGRLKL